MIPKCFIILQHSDSTDWVIQKCVKIRAGKYKSARIFSKQTFIKWGLVIYISRIPKDLLKWQLCQLCTKGVKWRSVFYWPDFTD